MLLASVLLPLKWGREYQSLQSEDSVVVLRVSCSESTFSLYASDMNKFMSKFWFSESVSALSFYEELKDCWGHEFHQHI